MQVFLPHVVLGSDEGHIPTFWLLLYIPRMALHKEPPKHSGIQPQLSRKAWPRQDTDNFGTAGLREGIKSSTFAGCASLY